MRSRRAPSAAPPTPRGCTRSRNPALATPARHAAYHRPAASRAGTLDGIPKDVILQFPKLTALVRTLNENPKIKLWNADKNPKLPWC